jgi:hypothetical protein
MQQNPPPEQPGAPWEAGPQQLQAPFSVAPPSLPENSRLIHRIALKYGLIFGLIIVVRLALGTAITAALSSALPELIASNRLTLYNAPIIVNIITAFYTLIDWVIYFLAGFFAAQHVPQVRTAIYTSLWVNGCYTLVSCVITGINLFLLTLALSQYRAVEMGVYISGIITQTAIMLILFHIVLGTAIGALGGLLGTKSVSNRKNSMEARFNKPE